jgi:hypothetical protein
LLTFFPIKGIFSYYQHRFFKMTYSLARDLKKCLNSFPEDVPASIIERVRFRAFLVSGQPPTNLERARAVRTLRKNNADQPRVPAGNSDGGEWTSGGGDGNSSEEGWIDTALLETCETQLYLDGLVCTKLNSGACWAQANFRYSACLRADPIPFFPYK